MKATKTYLVCPLNWGLGHASRLVPIIHQLQDEKQKVIIAGDGNALLYLKNEFPELKSILLKDLKIRFSTNGGTFNLIKILPQLIFQIFNEHQLIKKITKENHIDIVISDNRYGLWNKKTHSIFITHQLMIKLPKPFCRFERITHTIIKRLIKKYNECWIPDHYESNKNLSGDLSHKYKLPDNIKFIGPLSRFSIVKEDRSIIDRYDIVAIISGPEPSRSCFEQIILNSLMNSNYKVLIIQGILKKQEYVIDNNITLMSSLPSNKIKSYLLKTRLIICRSGYSSIMDLFFLNRKALIIPTPGQTEQEYLAAYHSSNFKTCLQNQLNIHTINRLIH